MRAPPESFNPITGAPLRIARSMILQIFCALDSESEPPNTVKSCAKTYTSRPSTRPNPVTNPSPAGRCDSMPKSVQWWRTNLSSSSKEPSSSSKLILSRAVSLPALCSRSRRSGPPPASASSLRLRNSAIRPCCEFAVAGDDFFSGTRLSRGMRFLYMENADSKVRGEPYRAEKQRDPKHDLRADCRSASHRRLDGRHFQSCADQHKHGNQRHNNDQNRCQNGSQDSFHEENSEAATNEKAAFRRRRNGSSLAQTRPVVGHQNRIHGI